MALPSARNNWLGMLRETEYGAGNNEKLLVGKLMDEYCVYLCSIPEPTFDELVAPAKQMAIDCRYGIGYRSPWWDTEGVKKSDYFLGNIAAFYTHEAFHLLERRYCPTVQLPNDYKILL